MITLRKTIPVSCTTLWSALTELDQMQQWYFQELKEFKAKVGFENAFTFEYKGKTFTHKWRVVEVEPSQKIAYYWQYEEYEGDSIVSFQMEKVPNGSHLHLEARILSPFPEMEEFSQKSMEKGWSSLIEDRLIPFLLK